MIFEVFDFFHACVWHQCKLMSVFFDIERREMQQNAEEIHSKQKPYSKPLFGPFYIDAQRPKVT